MSHHNYHKGLYVGAYLDPETYALLQQLPGVTQRERLTHALKKPAQVSQPAPVVVSVPAPLEDSEIIALVCTWPRRRLERLVLAVQRYAASQDWALG